MPEISWNSYRNTTEQAQQKSGTTETPRRKKSSKFENPGVAVRAGAPATSGVSHTNEPHWTAHTQPVGNRFYRVSRSSSPHHSPFMNCSMDKLPKLLTLEQNSSCSSLLWRFSCARKGSREPSRLPIYKTNKMRRNFEHNCTSTYFEQAK